MGIMKHFKNFIFNKENFFPFIIDKKQFGWVHPNIATILNEYNDIFVLENEKLLLNSSLNSFELRSEKINFVMENLNKSGIIKTKWTDEFYDISYNFSEKPIFKIKRSYATLLGVQIYGVHLNGYIKEKNQIYMWVAKRSNKNSFYPGKLDNIVAGGLTGGGYKVKDILEKEAYEEASITKKLIAQAKPTSVIRYIRENNYLVENSILFVYDLLLPKSFRPLQNDNEVESFELWHIKKVKKEIENSNNFKDNCNIVIIDFFIRHGILTPESPKYLEIINSIRQLGCFS